MIMSDQENEIQTVTLPALALRGMTVFPNMMLHFDVGREISVKALDEAMTSGTPIFLVAQRDIAVESPEERDLCRIGTICNVRQILRLPGDNVRVMVEGTARGRMHRLTQLTPYLSAEVEEIVPEEPVRSSAKTEALIRQTYELFERYVELAPKMTPDLLLNLISSEDPGYIADYIAQNIVMRTGDKQSILEELRPVRRLEKLFRQLRQELEVLELELDMQNRVREGMSRNQRDYYLREQLKVIQQELGEGEAGGDGEIAEYRQAIEKAKLPEEVSRKLLKEVGRLEKQPFGSAEATVLRNYLDVCLELPWDKKTKERADVDAVRKALDSDHYGLEKVKERILEFVAVKQLAPDLKGQVLCLVGPPGVGKTSIAMSMAKAMNRKLARISLGGVHDEAEIRGHRKTYIGAMPGRIIAGIRQAGSSNPLLLLDEIDKLGADHRGDPADALLEVLDGEQNSTFRDHFLEVPYDLSDVLFITTANTLDTIPRPLLDRMEVIELSSYTDEEKLQIARRHLLPKELKRHGLKKSQLKLTDGALREIITGYTKESGVRILERKLGAVCRKVAMRVVSDGVKSISVTGDNVEEFRRYPPLSPGTPAQNRAGGRGQRPGLDQCGRRAAGSGGQCGPRFRQAGTDRKPGRCHEGVGPRGLLLHSQPGGPPGHRGRLLSEEGHPCPLSGRSSAQGRPLSGHRHHHRHGLGADQYAGAAGAGHDRRGDAAGPGAGHWRPEGEDHGRPAQRHPHGAPAGGEREGSGGNRPDCARRAALPAGGAGGRGAGLCAGTGCHTGGGAAARSPGRGVPGRRRDLHPSVSNRPPPGSIFRRGTRERGALCR